MTEANIVSMLPFKRISIQASMVSSAAKLGKQSRQISQVSMKNTTINPLNAGGDFSPSLSISVFVSIPLTTRIQDGFRDITFEEISCAWWIEANIGRNDTFKTINYVGPQDLRYIILLFAVIKTGFQVNAYFRTNIGS
jgi:hypothetical protein